MIQKIPGAISIQKIPGAGRLITHQNLKDSFLLLLVWIYSFLVPCCLAACNQILELTSVKVDLKSSFGFFEYLSDFFIGIFDNYLIKRVRFQIRQNQIKQDRFTTCFTLFVGVGGVGGKFFFSYNFSDYSLPTHRW